MVVQRNFWRGNTSDFLIAETANASSDEIAADARSFVAPDIAQVAATGKVQNDEYVNGYFGMSFTAPGASFTAPSGIDKEGRNARLVDAVSRSARREDLFTISAVADRLSNYPELKSRSDYVDMASTALEHEGAKKTRGDFPFVISGIEFTGTMFEESDGRGLSHYRGIFATAMKGFMLVLDIAAPTEDKVVKLASSMRFSTQPASTH